MIKANIAREYPHHIERCNYSAQTLYLADYTNATKKKPPVRGTEIFEGTAPEDIECFELINRIKLPTGYIVFDNRSFTRLDGNPLSQCECVVFPEASTKESWIFFAELKYGNGPDQNNNDITKAIKQLYKTRTYYKNRGVLEKTNTCYLLASLPLQSEPFRQSIITPADALRLKRKHNVILRLQNRAEIQDDKMINV
jgi:hypothetical protein